ncbi:ABC transporter permease [Paenibacillus soyae]|uniref:ABC transporter permease n=1 Tax=Paenibacillus soyae TaxID=2969249 RepID=A0A9X2S724_9BACL|nr:ABC transporter permease [Paenibacillus soyae]MCR2802596.1 ABC transporter permease [Paenibacillus soyae]
MVRKEVGDHVRSWRFAILMGIILLACIGSVYSAVTALRGGSGDEQGAAFLQMFTLSDGTLPNFIAFVSFLGPLMGIALGFDAVNTERSKGTLSRLISQPIYRDDFLKAKFVSTLLVITAAIFSLGFLVMGLGLIVIGYPPTSEEFLRVLLFLLTAVVYIGFWLNLSILFSVRFRQATTSALAGLAVWIFFSVFYGMILNLIAKGTAPSAESGASDVMGYQKLMLALNRLSPSELFNEANTTLLMPSVRSLGPLTMEQVVGALPSPLPLGQSLLLVWPQLTGMLSATMICFGLSYLLFMRQEIRSRS